MDFNDRQARTFEFRRKLRDRAADLLRQVEKTSVDALETVLQVRMDTYFSQEGRLDEIEIVLSQIGGEIDQAEDLARLRRISDRLTFLENHLEEIDSILYDRPMRPPRGRFNPFDFFRQGQAGQSNGTEFRSAAEAYRELGLDENSTTKEIKKTFRKLIKALHPDRNNGDRSHEPRFRRLVSAYEYLIRRR